MTQAMHDLSRELLESRGLHTVATQQPANWQPAERFGGWGWQYPVYENKHIIGRRWKAFNETQRLAGCGAKYLWLPNKPDHPAANWYILPDVKQAVRDNNARLFIVNGEPAVLAMRAGGFANTISTTLSEIAVPYDAESVLLGLGARIIIYIYDNDPAGAQSALRWRDDIGHLFSFVFKSPTFKAGADANDLWLASGCDPTAFRRDIFYMPKMRLPRFVDRPAMSTPKPVNKTDYGLISAIVAHFNVGNGRINNAGFSNKLVQCPFHDDNDPSAGINVESGVLNCFVCGSHSPQAVAEQIGMSLPKQTASTPVLADRNWTASECSQVLAETDDLWQALAERIQQESPYARNLWTPDNDIHIPVMTLNHRLLRLRQRLQSGSAVRNTEYELLDEIRQFLDDN